MRKGKRLRGLCGRGRDEETRKEGTKEGRKEGSIEGEREKQGEIKGGKSEG